MVDTLKMHHNGTVKMIAHRGVSGLERENTAAAFVAAGNRSYYGIETDIHETADGRFIIIHDDNTLRVSGRDCIVEQTDYETLRGIHLLDRKSESTRADLVLPSLEEYISICQRYEKIAVLELKNEMKPQTVLAIARVIEQMGYLDQTIFNFLCHQKSYRAARRIPGCKHPVSCRTDRRSDCFDRNTEVISLRH